MHLKPKTNGQRSYIQEIVKNQITICNSVAGCGKTYISVGMAAQYLDNPKSGIKKIVLTRPVVESGEKLGYLPGNIEEKMDPYLRPLFEELGYFYTKEQIQRLKDQDKLITIPLAMMRGITFNNSFIILDEAQNATFNQMVMFVTRIGFDSKVVIIGDSSQSDLPKDERGAFKEFCYLLHDLKEVGIVYLHEEDIVRNPLVRKILQRVNRQ